jgi:SAM-dependent methyltransferase
MKEHLSEQVEANRRHWDEVVPLHAASKFYDLPAFKGGKTSLEPLELGELGDVKGKTLLHLQCHFGLDTLSWAREGATVTGIDFSPAAVKQAKALATELRLGARFIESSVYDLPDVLQETFDVVFTSYGVIGYRTSSAGRRLRRTSSSPAAPSTSPSCIPCRSAWTTRPASPSRACATPTSKAARPSRRPSQAVRMRSRLRSQTARLTTSRTAWARSSPR